MKEKIEARRILIKAIKREITDNPRWLVGSIAGNRYTGEEFLVEKSYADGYLYFLRRLGWIRREFLNKHFIISRVANRSAAPIFPSSNERGSGWKISNSLQQKNGKKLRRKMLLD